MNLRTNTLLPTETQIKMVGWIATIQKIKSSVSEDFSFNRGFVFFIYTLKYIY